MVKLSFHGACREVTGSCSLLEYNNKKILVDCGAFQGERFSLEKNAEQFDFNPADIDYLVLTHAHMDHCGRVPKLYKDGFRGKIYATAATRDLAEIMLIDAAHIIEMESLASGGEPLFLEEDVVNVMRLFEGLPYDEKILLDSLFKVKFRDAGHILGSAMVELYFPDGGGEKKIVFSGDLGNSPSLIIRDTEFIDSADVVIVESTYAGVKHETKEEGREKNRQAIAEVIANKST
jgi:metallo-beta-lactamase family protein